MQVKGRQKINQKIDMKVANQKNRESESHAQTSVQTLNGILYATKINQQQLLSKNFCFISISQNQF